MQFVYKTLTFKWVLKHKYEATISILNSSLTQIVLSCISRISWIIWGTTALQSWPRNINKVKQCKWNYNYWLLLFHNLSQETYTNWVKIYSISSFRPKWKKLKTTWQCSSTWHSPLSLFLLVLLNFLYKTSAGSGKRKFLIVNIHRKLSCLILKKTSILVLIS